MYVYFAAFINLYLCYKEFTANFDTHFINVCCLYVIICCKILA